MWEEGVPPGVLCTRQKGRPPEQTRRTQEGALCRVAGCHPDPACSILKEKICCIRRPGTTSHRTLKIHCGRLWLSQENGSEKIGARAVLGIFFFLLFLMMKYLQAHKQSWTWTQT